MKNNIYYTGTIVEVLDEVLYEVKVDIPGLNKNLNAFPIRSEVDQPRVGDHVILRSPDPVFQSYFLYQKIKENEFIGFRSNGKMVDITPDYIQITTFDQGKEMKYNDLPECERYRPEPLDWIKIDNEGNLEIFMRKNAEIHVDGDADIVVKKNASIFAMKSVNIVSPAINLFGTVTVIGSIKVGAMPPVIPPKPPKPEPTY